MLFYIFFLHNRERLALFFCINKHSIQFNSIYNVILYRSALFINIDY